MPKKTASHSRSPAGGQTKRPGRQKGGTAGHYRKNRSRREPRAAQKSIKARDGIEERLLNAYDKTRTLTATVWQSSPWSAIPAAVVSTTCRLRVQLEIGLHKKIIACEHCGRILVDQTIAFPESTVSV
jgi:hypothetical protein